MYSHDLVLNDVLVTAAFMRHPGSGSEADERREQYMLKLHRLIATALVREAMRECGDCGLCGKPFDGLPLCEACKEASHATDQG